MSRIAFAATTAVAAGVAFVFLLLPLLAIFLRVPIGDLFGQLGSPVFRDALVVSLKTSLIAHVSVLVFGTPTAYLLARKRFLGRGALITLIELPLVMPPAVAGIALLAAFGRLGLLGDELNALGIRNSGEIDRSPGDVVERDQPAEAVPEEEPRNSWVPLCGLGEHRHRQQRPDSGTR